LIGKCRNSLESQTVVARTKQKLGRPLTPAQPGKNVGLGLKVTASLKARLDAAAQESGRTQSKEAEARLEYSFRDQDRAELFHDVQYGRELAGLLELLGYTIRGAMQEVNLFSGSREATAEGLTHPLVFNAVRGACQRVLDAMEPPDAGSSGGAELGYSEARRALGSIADPPADDDDEARFGMFVRAKLDPVTVATIAAYLAREPAAKAACPPIIGE
jgi:hypothetical protein